MSLVLIGKAACLVKIVSCILNLGELLFTPPLVFLIWDSVCDADYSSNILDLVFSNITDFHITFPDTGMVKPDVYHPPLSTEIPLCQNMFQN
jgi:hypothetical protein